MQIPVTNQKTKSMRPASRDAELGSQSGMSATADARAPARTRLALPISNEQFRSDFRSQRIVHVLEPDKLSLQVAYSLLKAAHLRDDAGIWPADVAE